MIHYFPTFWCLYPKKLLEDFSLGGHLQLFFQTPRNTTQKHQHTKPNSREIPQPSPEVLICVDNLLLFGKYGRSPGELWPSWMGIRSDQRLEHFLWPKNPFYWDYWEGGEIVPNGYAKSWLLYVHLLHSKFRWKRKKELKVLINKFASKIQDCMHWYCWAFVFRENYVDIKWNLDVHPSSKRKKVPTKCIQKGSNHLSSPLVNPQPNRGGNMGPDSSVRPFPLVCFRLVGKMKMTLALEWQVMVASFICLWIVGEQDVGRRWWVEKKVTWLKDLFWNCHLHFGNTLANLTRIFVEPFLFFDAFIAMSPSTLDVKIQCLLAPPSKNTNKQFAATTTTTNQRPTTNNQKNKGSFCLGIRFQEGFEL